MSDNLRIRRPQDPTKINIHQDWELDDWSKSLGVSKDQLKRAVQVVGPMVADVKRFLNR